VRKRRVRVRKQEERREGYEQRGRVRLEFRYDRGAKRDECSVLYCMHTLWTIK